MDKYTTTPLFAGTNTIEEQLNLAKRYYTAKRYVSARYWFEMAASKDSSDAQYYLGVMYTEGQGVKKDIREAVIWTCAAAIRENAFAIQEMQSDEYTGHRAILLEDIDRYHPSDQYQIGLLFHNMEGPNDHDEVACEFFKKASAQGIEKANYLMQWIEGGRTTLYAKAFFSGLGSNQATKQLLSLINNESFKYVGKFILPECLERIVLQGSFSLNGTKYEILGQGSYGIVIREYVDVKYCLKLDIKTTYTNDNLNLLLSLLRGTSEKLSSDTSRDFAAPGRTVRLFNEINRELIAGAAIEAAQVVVFCGSKVVRLPLLTSISRDDEEREHAYTAMTSRCLQIYRDFGRIIPDIIGTNNAMWSDDTETRQLVFNDIPNSYRRESIAGLSFFQTSSSNLPNNIFNDYANYWKSYTDGHHCMKAVIKILIGLIVYDYNQSQVEHTQKDPVIQVSGGKFSLEDVALKNYGSLFNEVFKCAKPSNQYSHLDDCAWRKLRELMRKLGPDAPLPTELDEVTFFVTKKIKTSL